MFRAKTHKTASINGIENAHYNFYASAFMYYQKAIANGTGIVFPCFYYLFSNDLKV